MRLVWLILLLISAALAETKTGLTNTQGAAIAQLNTEEQKVFEIRNSYEKYIDTKPSLEKQKLALRTKEAIITFEATYPDSTFIPSMLLLLKEVDYYLDNE